MSLKVAFVHYHLRPGGVTRVIENAVRSLASKDVMTVTLTGEPVDDTVGFPTAVVSGLGYAATRDDVDCDSKELVQRMVSAARESFDGALPDVWHIHNHSLGKNVLFASAVAELASMGIPILLQIHDFAEDGRPKNYQVLTEGLAGSLDRNAGLYPIADHVHYAALNQRDLSFLRAAGAGEARSHILPNAVSLSGLDPVPEQELSPVIKDASRITLYPARGIRRKNLGEFVLWSTLAEEGELYALSLYPANPAERPQHDRWVTFSKERSLRNLFAAGEQAPFEHWVSGADRFISTSVAEGFGLAFLEPWLFEKPLVGRNLPEITSDFVQAGVDLEGLYSRLYVPIDAVDIDKLRTEVTERLASSYASYHREYNPSLSERSIDDHCENGKIDFGFLNESLQEEVVDAVLDSRTLGEEIFSGVSQSGASKEVVRRNADLVASQFGLDQYGDRLMGIYRNLTASDASEVDGLDGRILLDCFLSPEHFTLLRS